MAQMTFYGDTEVIEDDREGSEGTAVLCDDDEHSDGVGTPCTLPSMTCLSESGKRDLSLDAEACSTAEVGRSGSFILCILFYDSDVYAGIISNARFVPTLLRWPL
ncbi:unnamed protein product [Spirodela intermedia]|uniref:Uncharacterized protein n=1 Tax=Spirodela intermedia TaxID=51605 RepID=A0A7I8KQ51_SPIIN|nr:unnamed protein product [Spirodela intermedia]